MTETDLIFSAIGALLVVAASCAIASAARGSRGDTGWTWGLLGPVGWIISALRGIQDAIREDRATPPD